MHVTLCRLTLHENLFYATREIGRLYETGRYLHNYGLTYALEYAVAPYFNASAVPRYAEDFADLNACGIYVTPARPVEISFQLHTFKYADNRYRVKMEQGSRNTPSFGRAKELAAGSTFEFAIFSPAPLAIHRWVRLGKWSSKASVALLYREETAKTDRGGYTATLPLNPLDLAPHTQPLAYDIISMPPASLLDHVELEGPHYRLADPNQTMLPADMAYRT